MQKGLIFLIMGILILSATVYAEINRQNKSVSFNYQGCEIACHVKSCGGEK